MEKENMLVKAPEAGEPSFGKGPKALYSIDMGMLVGKLVVAMLNMKVFLIAQIYQAIVATLAIRVNNAFKLHTATNHSLAAPIHFNFAANRGFRLTIVSDFFLEGGKVTIDSISIQIRYRSDL